MLIEPENGWVDFLEDGIGINLKNKIVLQNKWIFLELHHIIKKIFALFFICLITLANFRCCKLVNFLLLTIIPPFWGSFLHKSIYPSHAKQFP